jgi:hypothetical protein
MSPKHWKKNTRFGENPLEKNLLPTNTNHNIGQKPRVNAGFPPSRE